MRRWVLCLLSLLLALQFTWAAAAGYCGHEESQPGKATHLGHHAHSHAEQAERGENPAVKAMNHATDMDHGHCHLVHAAPASQSPLGPTFSGQATQPIEQHSLAESFVPEGPERPNWLRA